MAGGTGTTMKVSAALRKAGLPVLLYRGTLESLTYNGIRVSNEGLSRTHVSLDFGDGRHAERQEREWADDVEAVLMARGFAYTRHKLNMREGRIAYSFTVYRTHEDPLYKALLAAQTATQAEDTEPDPATADDPEQAFIAAEDAAIAASGLEVNRATRKDWFVKHDGRRNAYYIERTGGTSTRARYSVKARGGRQIDKGLRSMAAALAAVQADIDS